MDVNSENFWKKLPGIIASIANSEYVAFDFEMSGIFGHAWSAWQNRQATKDDFYREAREIASTFNTIQFGMTCIAFENDAYRTETYCFSISPMFIETNRAEYDFAKRLNRNLTFSYATLLFLREERFNMDAVFRHGVTYLSCKEDREASERFLREPEYERIDLSKLDEQSKTFGDETKDQIQQWLNQPAHQRASTMAIALTQESRRRNYLHQRVLRQIIKDDFNNCEVWPFNNNCAMRIRIKDEVLAAQREDQRLLEFTACLRKQTGLRFVIDALTGREFAHKIDPTLVLGEDEQEGTEGTHDFRVMELKEMLSALEAKLDERRPVIIGHNQFYDLCFLYETFIDTLPEKLEDFKTKIHSLFPRIIDTKVLAMDNNEIDGDDPLADIHELLLRQQPLIVWDTPYGYGYGGSAHNAGYDSYMTAAVFLRLSHQKWQDSRRDLSVLEEWEGQARSISSRDINVSTQQSLPMTTDNGDLEQSDETIQPLIAAYSSSSSTGSSAGSVVKREEEVRLPEWENEFWDRFRNKIRLGKAGLLDLGTASDSERDVEVCPVQCVLL